MSKLLCILGMVAVVIATPASASVVFDFSQVGNDVVLTGSGSLDLAGATAYFMGQQSGYVAAALGLEVGGPLTPTNNYFLSSSAGVIGDSTFIFNGDSYSGDVFGVAFEYGLATVYAGYVSGTPLSGSTTFEGQTFASLGLTYGSYSYAVPNDTITVNVPAPAPEPAAWAMMVCGFGLVGAALRRRPTIVSFA